MSQQKNLTKAVLDFFSKNPKARLAEFLELYPQKQARSIYTLANRLKNAGFLEKLETRDSEGRRLRSFFRLTSLGQEKLAGEPKSPPLKSRLTWDGLWRLLIFDIPEEEKDKREYLRHELKRRSFYMLQLSVWITPYEVEPDLQEVIDEIGVRDYVRFLVVNEIDEEKEMLSFFNLKAL